MYYGGYRFDQPNHLYHVMLISHSFAYFSYDTLIEIYYGTDDLLTNAHHLIVVTSTYLFLKSKHGGFEYIGIILNLNLFNSSSSHGRTI